jgi:hypothetical protein
MSEAPGQLADQAGVPGPSPGGRKPIQSPLNLVMPIGSEEDYQKLHQTLLNTQALPPAENPIVQALTKIATVHFARFVFLEDNTRLAVITTYDGDFEKYVMDFINEIGDVFNMLLQFIADAPPLPVQEHRLEFVEYVRAHDLPGITFYSAYPDLTVLDILAAAESQTP